MLFLEKIIQNRNTKNINIYKSISNKIFLIVNFYLTFLKTFVIFNVNKRLTLQNIIQYYQKMYYI